MISSNSFYDGNETPRSRLFKAQVCKSVSFSNDLTYIQLYIVEGLVHFLAVEKMVVMTMSLILKSQHVHIIHHPWKTLNIYLKMGMPILADNHLCDHPILIPILGQFLQCMSSYLVVTLTVN